MRYIVFYWGFIRSGQGEGFEEQKHKLFARYDEAAKFYNEAYVEWNRLRSIPDVMTKGDLDTRPSLCFLSKMLPIDL